MLMYCLELMWKKRCIVCNVAYCMNVITIGVYIQALRLVCKAPCAEYICIHECSMVECEDNNIPYTGKVSRILQSRQHSRNFNS